MDQKRSKALTLGEVEVLIYFRLSDKDASSL